MRLSVTIGKRASGEIHQLAGPEVPIAEQIRRARDFHASPEAQEFSQIEVHELSLIRRYRRPVSASVPVEPAESAAPSETSQPRKRGKKPVE